MRPTVTRYLWAGMRMTGKLGSLGAVNQWGGDAENPAIARRVQVLREAPPADPTGKSSSPRQRQQERGRLRRAGAADVDGPVGKIVDSDGGAQGVR